MHRRQISGKWQEVQFLLNKKEEIIAKRFKIVLAEKPNVCRKQLKGQKVKKQLAKLPETKTIKADQASKEKLDPSASSPTQEMPGMHQPSTFSRKKLVSILKLQGPPPGSA